MNSILLICFFILVHNALASYDYFTLAETWPPTFCKSGGCGGRTPPNKFTIHGLWPSNYSKPHPSQCSTTPFVRIKILRLLPRLQNVWPSLSGNDFGFWKYEWDKHGTCSVNRFPQFDYFQLALNIWAKDNITNILRQAGMSPNSRAPYDTNHIVQAIYNRIHVNPQLYCTNIGQAHYPYLAEIRLCLDNNGARYINCPSLGGCGQYIYWPA